MIIDSEDLDEIVNSLTIYEQRKRDIALEIAKKEIDTINREYKAYTDGVSDAIRKVYKLFETKPEKVETKVP